MNNDHFYILLESLNDKEWNIKVDERWTIKDIVAHLVGWEEEVNKQIPEVWKTKKEPWFVKADSYDDFNKASIKKFSKLPPKKLLTKWYKIQNHLLLEIKKIGEDKLKAEPRLFHWVFDEGADSHYFEHYKQIKTALTK